MNIREAIRHSTLSLLILTTALAAVAESTDRDNLTHSKVWIYFADHGEASPQALAAAVEEAPVSARSLERRRLRGRGPATDIHDVPVYPAYVDRVRSEGCVVRHTSKYLNAVSALVTPGQIETIRALPFVSKVEPVRSYRRRAPEERRERFEGESAPAPSREGDAIRTPAALDYGASFNQVNQINVVPLHDSGYHGEGIMIGVFDTGFNLRHEAFQHLDVEAQWDFIFHDGNTENEPSDLSPSQHNHGTQVLSAMAGFKEGQLIGPAYAATFVLAKTERMFEEVVGEEDDFVRALEWADSIGVDIVSSSLGYYVWYDFSDLDGNTAITTIACDIAAGKGITVCTAAGNQRGSSVWPYIIAPADGDSVIAVGAVNSTGAVTYFSSPGPTADGRIKPDVAALGQGVTTVSPNDSLGYLSSNGTSFSTPLVAGACALILQRNAGWGPMDVLEALRREGSQSDSPDNDLGWGIIDAHRSALYDPTAVINAIALDVTRSGDEVSGSVFNGNSTSQTVDVVRYKWLPGGGGYQSSKNIETGVVLPGSSSVSFRDRLESGGVYDYVVRMTDDPVSQTARVTIKYSYSIALAQNRRNPFQPSLSGETVIEYTVGGVPTAPGEEAPIGSYGEIKLELYDISGARVATLVDDIKSPGVYTVGWDGRSDRGTPVASGVYFYRLQGFGQSLTRKLVLIRH
jgi:hypothetical protein